MSKKAKSNELEAVSLTIGNLERLARLIRSQGHEAGLHPVQWEALRYLSRANRFSNAPGALAKYLGATKGTVSQTVQALLKKNLVSKVRRGGDARSVALQLTDQGRVNLENDPLQVLEKTISALSDKTRKRFAKGLGEILKAQYVQMGEPSFGCCTSCRFFRSGDGAGGTCMHFNAELDASELSRICVEHVHS